ncbi:MAG: 23S rRNA (adenine(2503)-C(2))-methyltransferase RlmN [Chloroflexi bacterium]|nr:23S rRNA (adenine(2503)-C(2))-methyltransferase RlmN [Chloroflexota bacterium]
MRRGDSDGPASRLKPTLLDSDQAELGERLRALGEPPFRAKQLYAALHHRLADEWSMLLELPKTLRGRLAAEYRLRPSELVTELVSRDGTRKRLLRLSDGQEIETVAIPATSPQEKRRLSVCVSTQAGCAMACTFCATGTMGLARNLTPGEIVDQVYGFARDRESDRRPTHVVFMGMGEPLHNYEATLRAIRLLCDPAGMHLSQRRITLSTSGLVPEINRLAEEGLEITLAISLHAATDASRSRMMPVNRRYPVRQVVEAAQAYGERTGRRVSYEYVLLGGENDRPEDAEALIRLLPRRLSHVNLIPYNRTDAAYRSSAVEEAHRFLTRLTEAGLSATMRASRGRDIAAACGQLKVENARRAGGQRSSESGW